MKTENSSDHFVFAYVSANINPFFWNLVWLQIGRGRVW
jgi:hypothetical protein